jgi:hypothetical protein
MITKQEYIDSLAFELHVIRHLGEKIKPENLEFRPTPKQRSTQELMHFMAYIFGSAADNIKGGTSTAAEAWKATLPEVTLENFSELVQAQENHIKTVIGNMTEEELNETVTIYGRERTRASHLLNGPLKWAAAYKLQLFMYLKMTGQAHLGTMNLWAGMDPMPKE